MIRTLLASALLALAVAPAQASDPAAVLTEYLQTHVAPWAQDAALVSAIAAQNARTGALDAAAIEVMDQAWRAEVGASAQPTITPVVTGAAADFLRARVTESGGIITEVFVMDARGLNVAASGVTSDYWQGDEDKFRKTYPVGPEAVHLSEIAFDESSQSYQAQISIALTDPATGAVIGAMTVGVIADALM